MWTNTPHILLVNPWIHDFAAYDFWAKPLGLMTLGGLLREHGARISYLDCLNRFHPLSATGFQPPSRCGRGYVRAVSGAAANESATRKEFCRAASTIAGAR